MPGIWIVRDDEGVVTAACVAEYADQEILADLRRGGRKLEMVEADFVTLGERLPEAARVLR